VIVYNYKFGGVNCLHSVHVLIKTQYVRRTAQSSQTNSLNTRSLVFQSTELQGNDVMKLRSPTHCTIKTYRRTKVRF